jgi:protein-S-isoprenylcysteine O-methyltransferase Ste14
MTTKKNFYLYKWYADIIDEETDDVIIVYLGEIDWNILKLGFTNILQFLEKKNLISKATFSHYNPPILENQIFCINSMKIIGQWESKKESIIEKLYENKDGYILWECFMPNAFGEIKLDEKINKGFGYVERLTMTLKPWQIPINILHWGRFLTENQTVIWIRWEGKEEKFLVFHNHIKYINGIINDEMIEFGNYRLILSEKYILRNGPLIKTVFDKFSWMKHIFPSGLLYMNECKWQTWSILYENNCSIAQGWSIHENVDCKPQKNIFGKIFYGFLFLILLPLILIIWSKQTEKYIYLPIPTNSILAIIFILIGIILMILSMVELWIRGNGLPMNAYPPPKLVTTGVYQIFSHPIYIGASLLSFGLSIYYQSKSGFWLISPILTLSWLALVYGYENEDLKKRFPDSIWDPLINLPENNEIKCQLKDIISAYCLVLIPWLILYQIVIFVEIPFNSISTYLSFEYHIPVIEWTELFYLFAYPYVACLPFILQTKQQIRSYIITGLMNIFIGIYLQFIFPFVAVPREFIPTTILGQILLHERDFDAPSGAFPSFHVSWAFISGYYYAGIFPKFNFIFYILSILISVSCVTTGMHSIIDVLAGFILFIVCIGREKLWFYIRNYFEYLGNSWTDYRIGKLRLINHSFYAFPTGFIGFLIICSFIGNIYAMFLVSILSLIGAAIWGQFIEKSSGLSRPFGYFGCILGGIIGSIIASKLFTIPVISILSAAALAGPCIQGLGRLRCVIQGCCHGRPTNEFIGIWISNPRSRVCSISQIKNTYIHITPVYSILANILIGIFLWRLWYSNVSLYLIVSLYFILIGLSRFVEEAFRGEIQTPIYYKLNIYQWMSILFVIIGIVISMIPPDDHIRLKFIWKYQYLIASIGFGCIATFAMGVDFPESNIRFSKLSD